jgi:hypothetical protein
MVRRQEIHEHLARLLDSEQFVASRSVTKLLSYCVDAALEGNEETLKETTIGVFCFGRTPGYDTKQDPIVRVTARRLRAKLELFYQNEGTHHNLQIVLLKGTYVPRFHYRPDEAANIELAELPPDERPVIRDLQPAMDAESIAVHKVPAAMKLPVFTGNDWLRPAIWSLVIVLLMTSGGIILTFSGFRPDVHAVVPRENPKPLSLPVTDDPSIESRVPKNGTQIPMRRQVFSELLSDDAPTVTGASESLHGHAIVGGTDDMVAPVEPRL